MTIQRGTLTTLAILGGLAATAGGCIVHTSASARVAFVTDEPPPKRQRAETIEERPGHVWVEGHWVRRDAGWEWQDGHYQRERPGYTWVDGRWERRDGRWHWIDGRWMRGDARPARRTTQRVPARATPAEVTASTSRPTEPPPPPKREVAPRRAGHVWIAGHWTWNGGWQWQPGHLARERVGWTWRPGAWQRDGSTYAWTAGSWVQVRSVRDHRRHAQR